MPCASAVHAVQRSPCAGARRALNMNAISFNDIKINFIAHFFFFVLCGPGGSLFSISTANLVTLNHDGHRRDIQVVYPGEQCHLLGLLQGTVVTFLCGELET